jgi:hypothetical protein
VENNGFLFAHSSKMYRRSLAPDLDGWGRLFDVQMHVLQAASGRVGYIHQPLIMYRMNTGISRGRDGFSDHVAAIELAELLGARPAACRYAYARACFNASVESLRADAPEEFRKRVEMSVHYGQLRRPTDRVWRRVLWALRSKPRLASGLTRIKDAAQRRRNRVSRATFAASRPTVLPDD